MYVFNSNLYLSIINKLHTLGNINKIEVINVKLTIFFPQFVVYLKLFRTFVPQDHA